FLAMFDWVGTVDPTPWLCVADALEVMAEIGGSWHDIRRANRELALQARDLLCRSLQVPEPAPNEMLRSLVSVPLPAARTLEKGPVSLHLLLDDQGFDVLLLPRPSGPERVLTVSAQLYNSRSQYGALAKLLPDLLHAERQRV